MPGETIGFVGGTGCGKSTSLCLIQRLYNPQSGSILLDGRPIGDYNVHHLRKHLGIVAQTTTLFSTTIRENILYGLPRKVRESFTNQDLEIVCKQANCWHFITEFPMALETYAGERGVKLSGGQKQRLAIARAIVRKPSMLLLDEATSALDSKAEVVVQEALDKIIDGRGKGSGCTLMVAHRLSTLRNCNRIIVMHKGCIKETGSHEDLMKINVEKDATDATTKGFYRELYETQHGKTNEPEKLRKEIALLKERIFDLKHKTVHTSESVKTPKLGRATRRDVATLLPLEVIRHHSAGHCHSSASETTSVGDDSGPELPPLEVDRAQTTFDF